MLGKFLLLFVHPFDMTMTISFVEVSPSQYLIKCDLHDFAKLVEVFVDMFASQVMNASLQGVSFQNL